MDRKIRAVFFDAGNTLLYLDYSFIVEQLSIEGHAAGIEDVKKAEYTARRKVDAAMAAGSIRDEEIWPVYFSGMLRESGLRDEEKIRTTMSRIKEQHDYFGLWVHVPDEIRETLATLREEGYKLGIISNSDGSLAGLLEKTGIGPLVDFALDSYVIGAEKPDPLIFNIALEKAHEPPEACVHTGDIYAADVTGARAAGIHPVFLDPLGEKEADCDTIRSIPEIIPLINRLNGQG